MDASEFFMQDLDALIDGEFTEMQVLHGQHGNVEDRQGDTGALLAQLKKAAGKSKKGWKAYFVAANIAQKSKRRVAGEVLAASRFGNAAMNVDIAEVALLKLIQKYIGAIDPAVMARTTKIKADDWREAQQRVLDQIEDQMARKQVQIAKGKQ